MTQLVLNIENPSALKALKELVKNMSGVNIVKTVKPKKTGIELALEDIQAGRITEYASVADLIRASKS